MPAKNSRKLYLENGYYHIYNRGVEKRLIFQDQQDYSVFLSYLKEYLLPKDEEELYKILNNPVTTYLEKDKITKLLRMNNFSDEISLLAYCLMPNHFHFLIKQLSQHSIDNFLNSIGTRYTMYFNRKYKRVGSLYQSVYKAVSVASDEQLLHLSRYLHKQAISPKEQPSSYPNYLGKIKTDWVKTSEILHHFSSSNPHLSYESFVKEENDNELISELLIDPED